jgi:hypothetical protein
MRATVSVPDHLAYGGNDPAPNRVRGQDVADAAYNTAHGYPGGVGALALRMGVNKNTLTNKVNPQNTTHHLSLRESVAMQDMSGNYAVLYAMAEALGHTCTRATPDQSFGDPVDTFMRMQVALAEFSSSVADAVRNGTGVVTSNQVRRADYNAQELIASIGHVLAMMRGHMRPAPESLA